MGTQLLSSDTVYLLYNSGFLDPCVQDCEGNTILHLSLLDKNEELTDTILKCYKEGPQKSKAEEAINLQNIEGDTPLHIAARVYPNSELILALIDLGAQTDVVNKKMEIVSYEELPEEEEEEEERQTTIVLVSPGWDKEISTDRTTTTTTDNDWLNILDTEEKKTLVGVMRQL